MLIGLLVVSTQHNRLGRVNMFSVGTRLQHSIPNATLVLPTALTDGGSQPRFCDFDDEVIRLIKWHPSGHGFTATYSELVASRLGQLIEAPVVRGTVVYVDPNLLPPEVAGNVSQQFHVGFTYMEGQNFSDADYGKVENQLSLPRAAVQLAWLQMGDQEGHNQYLYRTEQILPDNTRRKKNHFIVIDQAAIYGTHDWSAADLQPDSAYNLPAPLKNRVAWDSVEPILEELRSIEEGEIRACFNSHPEAWGITDQLVDKVTDFVLERRNHLDDVLRDNLI